MTPDDWAARSIERRPQLVIRPRGRWSSVRVRELWSYRDLLRAFAARDLTLRYRQTALGVIWVVLQPLLGAVIFTFVFGRVARLSSHGIPYIVFSYAGLLAWNAFSGTVVKASNSLVGNAAMVSKVFFPRMLLPVSVVGSTLVDFGVAAVVLVLLEIGYGVTPGAALPLVLVWLLLLLMAALGLGLAVSSLTVRYRDVQYVLPVLIQLLLFASPIAYALADVPHSLQRFVAINPLTGLIEAFKWSVLGAAAPPLGYLLWSTVASISLLALGSYMFAAFERELADVI